MFLFNRTYINNVSNFLSDIKYNDLHKVMVGVKDIKKIDLNPTIYDCAILLC